MVEPIPASAQTLPVSGWTLGAPVLFLVFNRPEPTAQVFDSIRHARPGKLYIAADGPRSDRPDEAMRCTRVRKISLSVDWPCEIKTLFRDSNLGCRVAVRDALDWFFSQEEAGIVLEDDCLPSSSFFRYCDELLERYRDDPRVMTIGGTNVQEGQVRGDGSYYASKHFHCWGWASWRRAWAEYDGNLELTDSSLERGLSLLADGSVLFAPYWRQILRDVRSKRVDSWAYIMTLSSYARSGRGHESWHLTPHVNLVCNIGFGEDATHTQIRGGMASAASELAFPIRHPSPLARCADADRYTDRFCLEIRLVPFVKRWIALHFPACHRAWVRARHRISALFGSRYRLTDA